MSAVIWHKRNEYEAVCALWWRPLELRILEVMALNVGLKPTILRAFTEFASVFSDKWLDIVFK